MRQRRIYYSQRKGMRTVRMTLPMLRKAFIGLNAELAERGLFQECFGYECVDAGHVSGGAGDDVSAFVYRTTFRDDLWPVSKHAASFTEDALFDLIEFLHDHVSKGIDGFHHSWGNCGWHYSKFDKAAGQDEFRAAINDLLDQYGDGCMLTSDGEIVDRAPPGLDGLLQTPLPTTDPDNVETKVSEAVRRFRRSRATVEERHAAVRDLADVLEYLRPQLKRVLDSPDERDLFNVANNFAIRHHNPAQKRRYDKPIWLSWMFHFYLATIHASVRLIEKHPKK